MNERLIDPKVEADKLRSEAKRLLMALFKVPEGYSDMSVERAVDCIIMAAMLEIAALQKESADRLTLDSEG